MRQPAIPFSKPLYKKFRISTLTLLYRINMHGHNEKFTKSERVSTTAAATLDKGKAGAYGHCRDGQS